MASAGAEMFSGLLRSGAYSDLMAITMPSDADHRRSEDAGLFLSC